MPFRYAASTLFAVLLLSIAPTRAQNLSVYMTASSEVVGPGEQTTYTLTVANTGPVDLLDVMVRVQLPDHIESFWNPPGFDCNGWCAAGRVVPWTVGTLAPGESRTAFYDSEISTNAPEGMVASAATATAGNASDVSTSLGIQVDPTPLLRLSVAPEPGPAAPGEPFTYTLTFGNIGSASPSGVVLSMPLPEGTSFVEATGGGTLTNDIVTWDVGLLSAANGGAVRLTVDVDETLSDGSVLMSMAELDPGLDTEYVVRSSAVTPVRAGSPLHFEYAVSQAAAGAGDEITFTVTATNTGPVDLLDVRARLLLPGSIESFWNPPGFDCNGWCAAGRVVPWTVGTLAPGESRTAFFRTALAARARPGEVARSMLAGAASNARQVLAAQDVQVDPTPLLRLSVAPEPGPAAPGEPFTYTLTFGNIGSASPSGVVLSMPLPEGTSFVEATGGGTLTNDIVTWDVGLLGVGTSGRVQLKVLPNASVASGSLLVASAELYSGLDTEYVVRSSAVTPVRAGSPLHFEYAVSQAAAGAGDEITFTVTATNTGPVDLLDVRARLLLPGSIESFWNPPGFDCNGWCAAGRVVPWTVGTLAPQETRSITFATTIAGRAVPGEVLRTSVLASASNSGSNQAFAQVDVFVGASISTVDTESESGVPGAFALHANYPNPFNPSTTFRFDLPHAADVSLVVYDALGRAVATVASGRLPAGTHARAWDASGLSSGVYLYRLQAGDHVEAKTLLLLK